MVIAAFPPIIAILLALGGLGWAGFNLNMFLNVMTPLIMVISFSDSMQLTFAARDRLIAGQDKFTAFAIAPRTSTPDELERFIGTEITKWAQVVKDAGIVPE